MRQKLLMVLLGALFGLGTAWAEGLEKADKSDAVAHNETEKTEKKKYHYLDDHWDTDRDCRLV